MPNQRDPEKKQVGLWMSPRELAELNELARRLNTNKSELIRRLIGNATNPVRKSPDRI